MQTNICIFFLILLCRCHEDNVSIFFYTFSLHLMSAGLEFEKEGWLSWVINTASDSVKLLNHMIYAHVWRVFLCLSTIFKPRPASIMFRGYWMSFFVLVVYFQGIASGPGQYLSCFIAPAEQWRKWMLRDLSFFFPWMPYDCSTDTGLDWIIYFLSNVQDQNITLPCCLIFVPSAHASSLPRSCALYLIYLFFFSWLPFHVGFALAVRTGWGCKALSHTKKSGFAKFLLGLIILPAYGHPNKLLFYHFYATFVLYCCMRTESHVMLFAQARPVRQIDNQGCKAGYK